MNNNNNNKWKKNCVQKTPLKTCKRDFGTRVLIYQTSKSVVTEHVKYKNTILAQAGNANELYIILWEGKNDEYMILMKETF